VAAELGSKLDTEPATPAERYFQAGGGYTSGGVSKAFKVSSDGELQVAPGGIAIPTYDYVEVTYPLATQEVYTFRDGGVSGAIVATITINYTDSTKENLLTVAKT